MNEANTNTLSLCSTKNLPYYAKAVAEVVWKGVCNFEGFDAPTPLPPTAPPQVPPQDLFCSEPMDIAFLVDQRVMSDEDSLGEAKAFMRLLVERMDVKVSDVGQGYNLDYKD